MGKLNVFSRITRKLIGRDFKTNTNEVTPLESTLSGDHPLSTSKKFLSHKDLLQPVRQMALDNDADLRSFDSPEGNLKKPSKSLPGDSMDDWLNSISGVYPDAEPRQVQTQVFEKIAIDRESSSIHSDPGDGPSDNSSHDVSFKDLPETYEISNQENGHFHPTEESSLSFYRLQSEYDDMHMSMENEGADIDCHLSDPGAYGHHSVKSQTGLSWKANSAENNTSAFEFTAENSVMEMNASSLEAVTAYSEKAGIGNEEPEPFTFSSLSAALEQAPNFFFTDKEKLVMDDVHDACEGYADHFSDESECHNNDSPFIQADETAHFTLDDPFQKPEHVSELCAEMEHHGNFAHNSEPFISSEKGKSAPLQNFHDRHKFIRKDTRIRIEQWILESVLEFPVEHEDMDSEETKHDFETIGSMPLGPKHSFSASHLPSLQDPKVPMSNALLDVDVEAANRIARSIERSAVIINISSKGLKLIPGLSSFHFLRSVSIAHNSIARINPGALPRCLHVLDLSHNRLSSIDGLRDLSRLRILNLSHNRINRIGHGLSGCTALKELYLAGNKISEVEGLHRLLKLCILDLSLNKITSTKTLSLLAANYGSMQALNLIANPIHVNLGSDAFRRLITSLLPHLLYLNKQPVKAVSVRDFGTGNIARAATGSTHRVSKASRTKSSSSHRTSASNPHSSKPAASSGHTKTHRGKEEKDDKRHGVAKSGKVESKSTRHRHHHHGQHHRHHHHHQQEQVRKPQVPEQGHEAGIGQPIEIDAKVPENCRDTEEFSASEIQLTTVYLSLVSN